MGFSDFMIGNFVIIFIEDIIYVLNIIDFNCGLFLDILVIDFVLGLNLFVDGNVF